MENTAKTCSCSLTADRHSIVCCILNLVNNRAVTVCGSLLQTLWNLQEVLEKTQGGYESCGDGPSHKRGSLSQQGLIAAWTEKPRSSSEDFFLEKNAAVEGIRQQEIL